MKSKKEVKFVFIIIVIVLIVVIVLFIDTINAPTISGNFIIISRYKIDSTHKDDNGRTYITTDYYVKVQDVENNQITFESKEIYGCVYDNIHISYKKGLFLNLLIKWEPITK